MPLHQLVQHLLAAAPWTYGVLVALVIGVLAVQLTGTMNAAELADRRNHLPALLFPVLLATLAAPGSLGPAFLGMPFVLWAMRRTWSLTSGNPAGSPLFDAGLLLGIATLFYMPYAFLVVVVWASVSVIRPFQWREYLLPLLGLSLVFYLAWGVLRLLDAPTWRPLLTIALELPVQSMMGRSYTTLLGILLVGIAVVALYKFAAQYSRGVVREQNLRSSFLAFSATLGLIIGLVLLLNGWYPGVLLAVPLALLFTFPFLGTRKPWLSEAALFALLALALWKQYGM